MLRSHLTLAVRAMRRRLGYTLVSALGLTVALACASLVAGYVHVETTYDAFHPGAERIGRVYANEAGTSPLQAYRRTNGLVARRLGERAAGLDATTALHPHGRPVYLQPDAPSGGPARPDDRLRLASNAAYYVPAGDGFFDVFGGFEVLHGDATALDAPGGAVLTASLARRLFGTADAVGETFTLYFGTARLGPRRTETSYETLTVRAVTADVPARSHFAYQVVYSTPPQTYTAWSGAFTYVRLAEGADRQAVVGEVLPAWNSLLDARDPARYEGAFEPLTAIHLNQTGTRYLWALGVLALVTLLVAATNHTYLTAAMTASRSREVGARKVLGARGRDVARQFLLEAVALALLCVPPAVALASALTPAFNRLMGTALAPPATQPAAWAGMAAAAVAFGLAASVYPARRVARRAPSALFMGSDFGRAGGGGGLTVRRALVVAQFTVCIALGAGAVLLQQQVDYLQAQDPGFAPEGVVEITNGAALVGERTDDGGRDVGASQAFQRELLRHPDVVAVTSGPQFLRPREYPVTFRRTDIAAEPTVEAARHVLSPNALEVLGVTGRAGAYFDTPPAARRDSVAVVSRAVLGALGCDARRLGAACRIRLDEGTEVDASLPVVGVADNVRFGSASTANAPAVFYLVDQARRSPRYWHDLFVRFRDGVPRAAQIATLEETWVSFAPDRPMQYAVLTERIASFYEQDRRLRTLGMALTGVVLVLVGLGLVALTAYLTRLRMKEVAIRKVLGASVTDVLTLLSREFVALVALAAVLGSATAYLGMNRWLANFATRITVSPLVFVAVALVALALALAAVAGQALPAARVDPARVLRSE